MNANAQTASDALNTQPASDALSRISQQIADLTKQSGSLYAQQIKEQEPVVTKLQQTIAAGPPPSPKYPTAPTAPDLSPHTLGLGASLAILAASALLSKSMGRPAFGAVRTLSAAFDAAAANDHERAQRELQNYQLQLEQYRDNVSAMQREYQDAMERYKGDLAGQQAALQAIAAKYGVGHEALQSMGQGVANQAKIFGDIITMNQRAAQLGLEAKRIAQDAFLRQQEIDIRRREADLKAKALQGLGNPQALVTSERLGLPQGVVVASDKSGKFLQSFDHDLDLFQNASTVSKTIQKDPKLLTRGAQLMAKFKGDTASFLMWADSASLSPEDQRAVTFAKTALLPVVAFNAQKLVKNLGVRIDQAVMNILGNVSANPGVAQNYVSEIINTIKSQYPKIPVYDVQRDETYMMPMDWEEVFRKSPTYEELTETMGGKSKTETEPETGKGIEIIDLSGSK